MTRQHIIHSVEFIEEVLLYVRETNVNMASKKYGITRAKINDWRGTPFKKCEKKKSIKHNKDKVSSYTPRKIYSDEFKQEVLHYEKDHTITDTCDRYQISKYTINKWKGWVRKNVKASNIKWYSTKGKDYYSNNDNIMRHRVNGRNFSLRNPEYYKKLSKEYAEKHRFIKLADYSNRNFFRKKILNYYQISARELWIIAKRQKLICPISGYKLTNKNISVDHIQPISKGGSNEPSNIRLVDKWVNIMLYTKTDRELLQICEDIVNYNSQV